MSKPTPWEGIAKPSIDYNVRRIAGTSGVSLYWGRNSDGQSLMLVELTGDHTAQFRKEATKVHGIGLDLRAGETASQQRLVLTLTRHADQDLFLVLCETIVSTLSSIGDSQTALTLLGCCLMPRFEVCMPSFSFFALCISTPFHSRPQWRHGAGPTMHIRTFTSAIRQ